MIPLTPRLPADARGWLARQRRARFLQIAGPLGEHVERARGPAAAKAPEARRRVRIPIPTSGSSIRGSSFTQDNTATFYVGKTDCGQGTGTAFRQMMSDELDIAYDKTTCIMGSTDITVDQGGSGGSDAIQSDGWPMRRVAAEARRVLLEMASARFGVPVDQLAVSDARDHGEGRSLEARHLRRADRRQEVQRRADRQQHRRDDRRGQGEAGAGAQDRRPVAAALRHSRQGGRLAEVGRGREAARHGARAQREAAGRRRDADQHRRIVGAEPARIHQGGEQGQLRRGGLRARRAGDPRGADSSRSNWQKPATRALPGLGRSVQLHAQRDADLEPAAESWSANPDAAFAGAAKVIEADYDVPFQGHTAIRVRRTRWPIRRTAR